MIKPSTRHYALAQELIAWANAQPPDDDSAMHSAERVLTALSTSISKMVGSEGFRMVVARAVARAAQTHSLLDTAAVSRETGADVPFLVGVSAAESDRHDILAAMHAVLAEVLFLLTRFLGDDIAMRLVQQAVPSLSPGTHTLHEDMKQ